MTEEALFFTWPTALGAFLGYAFHVTLSWKEWAKLAGSKTLGFREFFVSDIPGQISGVLSVLITYFSLPLLGEIEWVKSTLNFDLQPNFLSASAVAFLSQSIAVKFRNIARKIDGDPATR
jgi:hypothetical protein